MKEIKMEKERGERQIRKYMNVHKGIKNKQTDRRNEDKISEIKTRQDEIKYCVCSCRRKISCTQKHFQDSEENILEKKKGGKNKNPGVPNGYFYLHKHSIKYDNRRYNKIKHDILVKVQIR